MENEVKFSTRVSLRHIDPALVRDHESIAVGHGQAYISAIQEIGTSAEAVSFGEIGNRDLGVFMIKNLDSANCVQVALDSGVSTGVFARLRPGQFCVVPANQNALYAKAENAAVNVEVTAIERFGPSFIEAGTAVSAASGNITLSVASFSTSFNNDTWIAVVHSRDNVSHSFTDWTQLFQANGGSTDSRLSVWYHRYAGSTPNRTVTHAAGSGITGRIAVFRGVKTSGSPADTTGSGGSGTDASIEGTSITPSVNTTLILHCNGSGGNNTRTDPAGYSQAFASGTSLGSGSSIHLAYKQHVSGATGTVTATQSASNSWASVLIALAPI